VLRHLTTNFLICHCYFTITSKWVFGNANAIKYIY